MKKISLDQVFSLRIVLWGGSEGFMMSCSIGFEPEQIAPYDPFKWFQFPGRRHFSCSAATLKYIYSISGQISRRRTSLRQDVIQAEGTPARKKGQPVISGGLSL